MDRGAPRLRVSTRPRGTPLGRGAGLVGAGLLFAGFNTGNNLFYLLFTVLAALELVGFWVSGRALRRLHVDAWLPARARAGAPARVRLRLTNRSPRLPVPALRWRFRDDHGVTGEFRTPPVPPSATATGTGRWVAARRGRLTAMVAESTTDFPLGLVRRRVTLDLGGRETLVEPHPLPFRPTARSIPRGEIRGTRPLGLGDEPVEAREYRAGDDARQLDWKASARLDRLMWRERRGSAPVARIVRLDRRGPAGDAFETRVSRAAGAVQAAVADGHAVGFASDEWTASPRPGRLHGRRILGYLAVVRPLGVGPEGA